MTNKKNGSTSSMLGRLAATDVPEELLSTHSEIKKKQAAKQFFEEVMYIAMMESIRVYHSIIVFLQEKRLAEEIEQKLKESEIEEALQYSEWMRENQLDSQTTIQPQYTQLEEIVSALREFISGIDTKINYFDTLIKAEQGKISALRSEEHAARQTFAQAFSRIINQHKVDQDFVGITLAVPLTDKYKSAAGAESYSGVMTIDKETYLKLANEIATEVNAGKLPLHHVRTAIQEKFLKQLETQLYAQWQMIPPNERAIAINEILQSSTLKNLCVEKILGEACKSPAFNDVVTKGLVAERKLAEAELRLHSYESYRDNLVALKSNAEKQLSSIQAAKSSKMEQPDLAAYNNDLGNLLKQDVLIDEILNENLDLLAQINIDTDSLLSGLENYTSPTHLAFDNTATEPNKIEEKLHTLQTQCQTFEEKCLGELSENQQVRAAGAAELLANKDEPNKPQHSSRK